MNDSWSNCPSRLARLSTSLGRFDWRWRLLLTSGIIWLPEYFREAAPSRRLTKIQISLLQLRLPSEERMSSDVAATLGVEAIDSEKGFALQIRETR